MATQIYFTFTSFIYFKRSRERFHTYITLGFFSDEWLNSLIGLTLFFKLASRAFSFTETFFTVASTSTNLEMKIFIVVFLRFILLHTNSYK